MQQPRQPQQSKRIDLSERWIDHQRKNHKTTASWNCCYCAARTVFTTVKDLVEHGRSIHTETLPDIQNSAAMQEWTDNYMKQSSPNIRQPKDDQKSAANEANRAQAEPPPGGSLNKRPLSHTTPIRSLSGLQGLNIGSPRDTDDAPMEEAATVEDKPRKRAAIGDGISAGSASPTHQGSRNDSHSPPPQRSKARPVSSETPPDFGSRKQLVSSPLRPNVPSKKLWNPDQDPPLVRGSFDPSNIASAHAQKSRAPGLQSRPKKTHPPAQAPKMGPRSTPTSASHTIAPSAIYGSNKALLVEAQVAVESPKKDHPYDLELEPETRPISQEQLVAEVKGIYAGLVMVEAKCIEVDNKQALTAQQEGVPSKLSNDQWRALIALHRTLLHEHHDFFLASQHPSASPALRRLASKYAMPARMWRHGIHSFLELLRHRLPASRDHMLAFIYLAYSMMALLFETVPAFEDTWIECLGDLGRYRMAIEDDDIRDRDVWTGVARFWYAKASDKAPTTGRLYHHLAILARPNALQQLFYYSKSLCVPVPFTSARESILTLFEPILNTENTHVRLPPVDTAFVQVHGLLFMNKNIDKVDPIISEFLKLLDSHIGRVTRKFMEQGYQISVANIVSILGFASKDNLLMQALSQNPNKEETSTQDPDSSLDVIFQKSEYFHNESLKIVLERIGDPNVLPFIHTTLVFMARVSRRSDAMKLLETNFPWKLLVDLLNSILPSYDTFSRIEDDKFPVPEKDDARPLPEDFALRGLLWADNYFPDDWFTHDKIDEEEKYQERASMTAQRQERVLWLAVKIAKNCEQLHYDSTLHQFSETRRDDADCEPLTSEARTMTFASASTGSLGRANTWTSFDEEHESGSETQSNAASLEDIHMQ